MSGSTYRHKSGATKRKEKEKREQEKAKLQKLDTFFVRPNPPGNEVATLSHRLAYIPLFVSWLYSGDVRTGASCSREDPVLVLDQQTLSSPVLQRDVLVLSDPENDSSRSPPHASDEMQSADDENPSLECFPTDRANFAENIQDANIKRYILKVGPCRPKGPFPTDEDNRCFSESYYTSTTKVGMKIARSWMCYSPKLDCCYCEPCWLFASRNAPYYNNAWVNGIKDWKHLSTKIERHESTQIHLGACIVYEQWKLNGTIDAEMERNVRDAALFWRQVLERIVNVTLTLASCNLAFRGHREILGHGNAGNFLSIIELLARYDPVLKELINRPGGSVKYLSHQIQDEIIYILSQRVKSDIIDEINDAPFYSIITDTTQDVSKIDQLSQVYCYVTVVKNDMNIATDIQINEVFLGFEATAGSSASELENKILGSIEKNKIDLSKCRGQGYDGAANMSGEYSGVQARITEKEPLARYVHCAAHNLNLALNDSVKNVPGVRQFYDTVEMLFNFFGHSIKRWALLSEFMTPESRNITLKRLCPTRWSSRHDALFALRHRYGDIMKGLVKISLTSDKKEERDEASALKNSISKFSFIFLVNMQTKTLECINAASQLLQAKDVDILKASTLLQNAISVLMEYREQFDEAKSATLALAIKWGSQTQFEATRARKVKRHFDELSEDRRFTDAERNFRVNVFNACLDIIIQQLSQRFVSLNGTAALFEAIHPNTLALTTTFSEVCTALLLFLTLPVTVATSERSFSKLKLIKNHLRSTMGQERLSGLAILSIENERAGKMYIRCVVDEFAERKARHVPFK
uniref:TTF-type domain-containing protein n=1 Tax=Sphaeramia orbicularis TaxID=375764 RepID=A0A673B287_9TELE